MVCSGSIEIGHSVAMENVRRQRRPSRRSRIGEGMTVRLTFQRITVNTALLTGPNKSKESGHKTASRSGELGTWG